MGYVLTLFQNKATPNNERTFRSLSEGIVDIHFCQLIGVSAKIHMHNDQPEVLISGQRISQLS